MLSENIEENSNTPVGSEREASQIHFSEIKVTDTQSVKSMLHKRNTNELEEQESLDRSIAASEISQVAVPKLVPSFSSTGIKKQNNGRVSRPVSNDTSHKIRPLVLESKQNTPKISAEENLEERTDVIYELSHKNSKNDFYEDIRKVSDQRRKQRS